MTEFPHSPRRSLLQHIRQFVRPVLGPAWRLLRRLYERHELALLRAPARPVEPRPFRVVERIDQPDAVLAAYTSLGRSIAAERVRQRLAQGLRFFELYMDDRLVATTWIVWKGARFIDELGYQFPIPPRSFWIRDIFVTPEVRGQRLFSALLDALIAGPFKDCDTLWSDVEPDNPPSLKAHFQYGFREISRVRGRHVGRLLLVRSRNAEGFPDLDGFKPGQAVVFTGPAFARYCRRRLA